MAIRTRNLDFASDHLKGNQMVSLGDITATTTRQVFVAPVPCVVNFVDVYSNQAVAGASQCAILTLTLRERAGGSSIATRSTSATAAGADTNSVSAGGPYRLRPTANNSFSIGAGAEIVFNLSTTAVLSAVAVIVNYTPLLHRESR